MQYQIHSGAQLHSNALNLVSSSLRCSRLTSVNFTRRIVGSSFVSSGAKSTRLSSPSLSCPLIKIEGDGAVRTTHRGISFGEQFIDTVHVAQIRDAFLVEQCPQPLVHSSHRNRKTVMPKMNAIVISIVVKEHDAFSALDLRRLRPDSRKEILQQRHQQGMVLTLLKIRHHHQRSASKTVLLIKGMTQCCLDIAHQTVRGDLERSRWTLKSHTYQICRCSLRSTGSET